MVENLTTQLEIKYVYSVDVSEKKYRLMVMAAPMGIVERYYDVADMLELRVLDLDYVGNSTYWVWPTSKPYRISSCYQYRNHPIRGQYHFHAALDITGTKSKNIYAIQSGTVISAFNDNGYHQGAGNNIKIEHANNYVSQYMHLAKSLVKVGDHVEKGQLLGIMGRTGSATGVHLDFRVFKNGNNINPFSIYYKTAYPCYGK